MRLPGAGMVTAAIAATAAVAAAAVLAGPAGAHGVARVATPSRDRVEKATVGGWTATLRLRVATDGDREGTLRGLRLRVTRGATQVLDGAIALPSACVEDGCVIPDASYRTLALRRLGAGPAPVVLLWHWTGGAHCCSVVQAVSLPDGRVATRDFGNGGAVVRLVGGAPRLVGQDERFPYRYTSYAASGSPVQVFDLVDGGFRDVTADHLGLVRNDAKEWWGTYVKARTGRWEARGVFAAWAADACRLGQRDRVEARLAEGVARGFFSPPRAEDFGPHGDAYAKALIADLEKLGYCAA